MARLSRASSPSSCRTLQRIPTSQLRPGMFLVRVLDSWWKSPFFVHRRLLNTPTEVEQLMSSGIREVEIDTSLGVEVSSESESDWPEHSAEETDILLVSCDQEQSDADSSPPLSVSQPSGHPIDIGKEPGYSTSQIKILLKIESMLGWA